MATRFSIVHQLKKSRWGESHLPNKKPKDWKVNLEGLRRLWEIEEETILETAFYEPFQKGPRKL